MDTTQEPRSDSPIVKDRTVFSTFVSIVSAYAYVSPSGTQQDLNIMQLIVKHFLRIGIDVDVPSCQRQVIVGVPTSACRIDSLESL